jgi:hypothetical protein
LHVWKNSSSLIHSGREILDPFASPVDAYSHTNNFRSLAISNRADCPWDLQTLISRHPVPTHRFYLVNDYSFSHFVTVPKL